MTSHEAIAMKTKYSNNKQIRLKKGHPQAKN